MQRIRSILQQRHDRFVADMRVRQHEGQPVPARQPLCKAPVHITTQLITTQQSPGGASRNARRSSIRSSQMSAEVLGGGVRTKRVSKPKLLATVKALQATLLSLDDRALVCSCISCTVSGTKHAFLLGQGYKNTVSCLVTL
jgi:hypothetical protein